MRHPWIGRSNRVAMLAFESGENFCYDCMNLDLCPFDGRSAVIWNRESCRGRPTINRLCRAPPQSGLETVTVFARLDLDTHVFETADCDDLKGDLCGASEDLYKEFFHLRE